MNRPRRIKVVLGTRGSKLALAQTEMVVDKLRTRWAGLDLEVKVIKTRGDNAKTAIADVRAGRKGLFTGAIERELIKKKIDVGVHSAKDLPSTLASGSDIAAVLPRAAVEDVLVSTSPCDLESIPRDGIVATGSVRRQHQLRWKRPDLEIVELRGNVPRRLSKLATGQWHAIILASAGLQRLGLDPNQQQIEIDGVKFSTAILSSDVFLPAGGQGVIAMQIRTDNEQLRDMLDAINDFDTRLSLRAEREFLRLLQADCNQPVGVLASVEGSTMKICGQIFDLGATVPRQGSVEGRSEDAEKLAAKLLDELQS